MRTTIGVRVVLLSAVLALVPATAWGQGEQYTPEDLQVPLPLGSTRPDSGVYGFGGFLLFHETRPVSSQAIAYRGFILTDGSVPSSATTFFPAGTSFVNNQPVLVANDLGSESYQPGFSIGLGYKFENGVAVEVSWWHLFEAKYSGGASFAAPFFQNIANSSSTFLFSPVYDYSDLWNGPDNKTPAGDAGAILGIWNGATYMTTSFIQRFDQWDITGRIPVWETTEENREWRTYGLVGGRMSWIWEKFTWITVSEDQFGNADPTDEAIYTNRVSNRLYGPFVGCGTDWRLCDTPIGTFSLDLELEATPMIDIANDQEKYLRGDAFTSAHKNAYDYTFAPELQAEVHLTWYPVEFVELKLGYNVMAFFNTVSASDPVSFNLASPDTQWNTGQFRLFNGLDASIGFLF